MPAAYVRQPGRQRDLADALPGTARAMARTRTQGDNTGQATFYPDTGFWFCPLRSQDGAKLLGLLAVVARTPDVQMDEDERAEAEALLTQAAAAVADRYVQEGVFATLQTILPDLERIQEWRSVVRYASPAAANRYGDVGGPRGYAAAYSRRPRGSNGSRTRSAITGAGRS